MNYNPRMRRLRFQEAIRDSLQTSPLHKDMFIYPLFLVEGQNVKEEISSLPGLYHFSVDKLVNEVQEAYDLGLRKFLLFGHGDKKDEQGSGAYDPSGVVPRGLRALKETFGDKIVLFSDVCLCPYTSHGHCGIPDTITHEILNDKSLPLLAKAALTYAEAGSDWVAPSDMMDFRVKVIRDALDEHGFTKTAILSYSVKFASGYYGPFRGAVDSAPRFGDRSTYQMDYRDARQAIREALLDEQEGADALMVKPALAYLDIIKEVRNHTLLPLAAYNVSGEYSMVKLAGAHGLIDEQAVILENLHAIARAGADWIITYHAKEALQNQWVK